MTSSSPFLPLTPQSTPRCVLPSLRGVWRADQLGTDVQRVQSTGHALLDAQLPGGGWPLGALTEVLQPTHGAHEWRLVLPALGAVAGQGAVVLVAPPHEPFGPALQGAGVPLGRLCRVARSAPAADLWACEQALRCRDVRAVLAWLPQAPPAALRRLQLAAAQTGALLWVFRPLQWQGQASPAVLRLRLQGLPQSVGFDMQVYILKRRGPPLAQPLVLPATSARLATVLAAQAARRLASVPAQRDAPLVRSSTQALQSAAVAARHALDRIALAVR